MDYKELAKSLRYEASYAYLGSEEKRLSQMMREAADAIEELVGKIDKLQKTQQLEERTLPVSPFEDFFRYYAEKYGTGMPLPEPPKEET